MRRRTLLKTSGATATALVGVAGAQTATAQPVSVTISGTNSPVSGTQWLSVSALVTNQSSFSTVRGNARLIVGHDPDTVDSTFLSLSPGETRQIELGYRTWDTPRTQRFPARIFFDGSIDSVTVTVTPA